MKTLYLECNMGASGDMLMGVLLHLLPEPDAFTEKLNSLGIPGVRVSWSPDVKCGIQGMHVTVEVNGEEEESLDFNEYPLRQEHRHDHEDANGHEHNHEHSHHHTHSSMADIRALIDRLSVSERVKADAQAVYRLIAEAEAHAHGKPVEQIHFHEVGTMDAVADIVGVCLLMELLQPQRILASAVSTGFGQVRCAHGILPVPAPATAHILRGVPVKNGMIRGELCTPTGAALLKHFVFSFGPMPAMTVEKIGYGTGKKDFEAANCVRAFWGESADTEKVTERTIAELKCNLDDMTPEAIGFAEQVLFENGALDVFTIPTQMKKSRPGILLTCLCPAEKAEEMALLILRHTTTRGVRKAIQERYTLDSETTTVQTEFGEIRMKVSSGYGLQKAKPEYDDVAKAASRHKISFQEVWKAAMDHYDDFTAKRHIAAK